MVGEALVALWDVKQDDERDQWAFRPLLGVGPLRFGASHDEVVVALGGAMANPTHGDPGQGTCVEAEFGDLGVTAYYAGGRLFCVAVDALVGPQVSLGGLKLVGRVPSEAETAVIEYAKACGAGIEYTHAADPGLPGLGLILRVQRAGDVVLTRPIFLDQPDAVSWDYVPDHEWSRF
jgi:hypothetical protein